MTDFWRRMRLGTLVAAVALVGVLALSGCGDDDKDKNKDEYTDKPVNTLYNDGMNALAVDHDRVVERAAQGQARRAQTLDIVRHAEGARARDLALEGAVLEGDEIFLARDRGGLEIDLEAHREAARGRERRAHPVVADRDVLQDLDRALLGARLRHHAGAIDQEHERGGAAVHRRHFRPVELDRDIVQMAARDRGEQMLDRRDRGELAVRLMAERRAEARIDHVAPIGDDLGAAAREVGATKHNSRVGCGGQKGHRDLLAGMEADA